MIKIYLYSTLGCHLCEDALVLLSPYINRELVAVDEVDIADSDELMELYAVSIPVLKKHDSAEELAWPFGKNQLETFLK
jgi:hypothetical protein